MTTSPPRLSRRALLIGGVAVPLIGAGYLYGLRWRYYGDRLDPVAAHRGATGGDLLLVDIRRPDEWHATGIGEGAVALDMRAPDFTAALDALAAGDRDRPIALICARGVRTARLSKALSAEGFGRIIDVPEGMLGSLAGPGWLKRGLPVVPA